MLSAPISIQQSAAFLETYLGNWAKERGGTAKAVANMQHLWEEIYLLSESPRILICYNGEKSRGGFNVANTLHRVDRNWTVVIMRGHGWGNAVATIGQQGEQPFYDIIEEVRELLRIVTCITEEFPIDYKGMAPVPNLAPGRVANVFMDAYSIEFSTANDIPAVTMTQTP